MSATFLVPTDDDLREIAKRWLGVSNLVKEEYGEELDLSEASLGLIQRVIDDSLLDPTNTYGLQCLGAAFGRIFCKNNEGYDWWIVDDEYGRDPCVRYKETTIQLNVLTMISKRIEDGEHVDAVDMYQKTIETLDQILAENRWK